MTKQQLTLEQIKARIKIVCICKGIKQSTICDAITVAKCSTLEAVNKKTGSGSGGCKGVRCGPVIKTLLENNGVPILNPHQAESANEADDDFND